MEIKRSVGKHGNLVPSVWNVLCQIPSESLHHGSHGIRHPKSAYSTSLRAIFDQWNLVLDELDRMHSEYRFLREDGRLTDVLTSYREFLYRLNEHYDACLLILRSLFAPIPGREFRRHVDFLNALKPPGWSAFRSAIRPYKEDRLGIVVNAMKHDLAQLRGLYFYGSGDFRPGYYLCNVSSDGSLGPVARLHQDGNTAFSFARDMLIHFWWIFRIGNILAESVIDSSGLTRKADVEVASFDHETWPSTIERLSALPLHFFPDEVRQPFPRLVCHKDMSQFSLVFPTPGLCRSFPKNVQVRSFLNVDMDHPVNKLPYFGGPSGK